MRMQSVAVPSSIALLLAANLVGCNQPNPKCNMARGVFSVKYTLVPGTKAGGAACDAVLDGMLGEDVYVQSYSQKKADSPYPDPNRVMVGFEAAGIKGPIDRAACGSATNMATEPAYSTGLFAESEPNDDVCTIPSLSPGHVVVPAVGECMMDECTTLPPADAVDALYEWSNLRVYVTAGADGTQFTSDVRIAVNGCSASYKAVGVYPSVSCGVAPTTTMNPATGDDAGVDGGPVQDAGLGGMDSMVPNMDAQVEADGATPEADAGMATECPPPSAAPVADQNLCSQSAPLMNNVATGSMLNPEFMVQCDPVLLHCVLTGDPPSLR